MQSDLAEVRLVRWALPSSPKNARGGEEPFGAEILDGAGPAAGASVAVPRAHRSATVGPDGSFWRNPPLPPGTWVIGFRRSTAPGTPEAQPAELKVTVAPGGTVDMGTLQLSAQRNGAPPPAEPEHSLP